ncbi:DNA-binding NarL/FixJ family response regulator [Paenibacillus sp. PastF-3]|jgi:DNA-binding NarL/FixJ family response regulator|uniref:response regulator transcription factor n=1 Tax=Paenibacillus TaxID=44249 RepID=UPI0024756176|nr:response regulator transcription factor [Paenibacillus sp. PastF-3]MDH6370600.1 DNA-binding NarL/FixJ family response regulator [Paenibacillus sp. PastF-3]
MTTPSIRVLLADDQHLVRHGLRFIINAQEDMEVVGEASGGHEAVLLAVQVEPHVLLMDVQMHEGDGIDATRRIVETLPYCKVVFLTTFDQEDYVYRGIRAGAVGYLLKDAAPDELVDAVRAAYRGEAIYRTTVAAKVIGQAVRSAPEDEALDSASYEPLLDPFTERELQVLQQMAYGLRNEQIARKLYIGESTVKTHVHRILQKIQVDDRTQAVVFAIRNRYVK